MPTDVVMPQMGESIAEGTIVRWIKKVGEKVDRDEPRFEISTDKVDAEIPSPAAGVVSEIRVKEGETVAVNSVVAVIGGETKAAAPAPKEPLAEAKPAPPPKPSPQADGISTPAAAPSVPSSRRADVPVRARETPTSKPAPSGPVEDVIRERSSPLVRKIAREHNVDISQLRGTGIAGRVTKDDILAYVGREGREGLEGR